MTAFLVQLTGALVEERSEKMIKLSFIQCAMFNN